MIYPKSDQKFFIYGNPYIISYIILRALKHREVDENSHRSDCRGIVLNIGQSIVILCQAEAEVTVKWFSENLMQANPAKCQGILLKWNKHESDFNLSIRGQDIDFSESITTLGICIDENLTFDIHVNNICLKASRQISALQRLTGLFICLAGRQFIKVASF